MGFVCILLVFYSAAYVLDRQGFLKLFPFKCDSVSVASEIMFSFFEVFHIWTLDLIYLLQSRTLCSFCVISE